MVSLHSTAQTNPFRPSPSYSANEGQYLWFTAKIFSRSGLSEDGGGGGRENFVHRDQNSLSTALNGLSSANAIS
jgi:hypothetical protein